METFLALTLGGSILILLLVLLNRVFGKHLSRSRHRSERKCLRSALTCRMSSGSRGQAGMRNSGKMP